MPLQFQEADFKDGKAIANVYIRAFFDDPFQKSLYPGKPFDKQVASVISRGPNNYSDISAYFKIVVDTDTGEVVSYSKWSFAFTDAGATLRTPTGLPENFKPVPSSPPKGLNDPFATDFTKRAREARDRILRERPQLLENVGNSTLVSVAWCCKPAFILGD